MAQSGAPTKASLARASFSLGADSVSHTPSLSHLLKWEGTTMPAAETIHEETNLAVEWAEENRSSARASEIKARRAWFDARPVDVTEAAWTAQWEVFAANAIRAVAHARDAQASAERRIEELEASDSTDDHEDTSDDDADSADDEEYGWDGSPVSSDEDWDAWDDVASAFQQVASDWEDAELLWTALAARIHTGQLDLDDTGTA